MALEPEHAGSCHQRWIQGRNNLREGDDLASPPDEWFQKQCGKCRYHILLRGVGGFGSDWGVRSQAKSPFDGHAMFEHDGCTHYEGASSWISDHPAFTATDSMGD